MSSHIRSVPIHIRLWRRSRALIRRLDQICAGAGSKAVIRGLSLEERSPHHRTGDISGQQARPLNVYSTPRAHGYRPKAREIDP